MSAEVTHSSGPTAWYSHEREDQVTPSRLGMSGESLRAQPLGQNIHASYLDTSVLRSDKELTGYWWDHEMGNSYNFSHLEDMEVALSSRESWYNSLIDEV